MDYLWSVGVMEYWVRAIFLERKFTIKSVIPRNPGSVRGSATRNPGFSFLDRHDGEPPDYLLK